MGKITIGSIAMFFSQHKRLGTQTGQGVWQTLQTASLTSSLGSKGFFDPPSEFYFDSYISGFVIGAVTGSLIAGAKGSRWSSKKKGEFMMCALEVVDPSLTVAKIFLGDLSVSDQNLHAEGNTDGLSVSMAVYNGLKPDDPDPKVVMAREMAEMFSGTLGSKGDLGGALISLTIQKYMAERWGEA